jgi:predicted outer membrane repeat protein
MLTTCHRSYLDQWNCKNSLITLISTHSAKHAHISWIPPTLPTSCNTFPRLPSALLDDLWAFNLEQHTWTQLRPFGDAPAARQGHSLLVRDSILFVAGGEYFSGGKWVQAADIYMLDLSLGTAMSWRSLVPPTDQVTKRPIYSTNAIASGRKHVVSSLASVPDLQKLAFMHPKDLEFIPVQDPTYVPPSDFLPLAAYISAAFDGDTILLPHPPSGAPSFTVKGAMTLSSSITIQGASSLATTLPTAQRRTLLQSPSPTPSSSSRVVIDCNGDPTAFIITAGGVLLANLEIRGCTSCAVVISRAPTDTSTAPVSIVNCLFHSNTGPTGPAITVLGSSFLAITTSLFANNTATNSSGGAIALDTYSTITAITASTFHNNTAATTGGAVHASKFSCITAISDTTFSANTAGSSGGAIHSTSPSCSLSITTTLFENNTASAADGGAIALASLSVNTATLTNVTLTANSANINGGALYISSAYSSVNLVNITASRNTAGQHGGVVMLSSVAALVVASSVFYGNAAGQQGGAFAQYKAGAVDSSGSFYRNNTPVYGGAICLGFDSTLTLSIDSFFGNSAVHGGAVECVSCDSVMAMGTVFEGNQAAAAGAVALITPRSTCVMQVGVTSFNFDSRA